MEGEASEMLERRRDGDADARKEAVDLCCDGAAALGADTYCKSTGTRKARLHSAEEKKKNPIPRLILTTFST